MKVWRMIQSKLEALSGLMLLLTILIIFLQVVTRYVFFYSLPWSEELTRYLFIWFVFLSLSVTIRDNLSIRIDFMEQILKGRAKKILGLIVDVLSLVILVVFVYSSYRLFLMGFRSKTPAMGIPFYVIYSVMPIGYFLAAVEMLIRIILKITGKEESTCQDQ